MSTDNAVPAIGRAVMGVFTSYEENYATGRVLQEEGYSLSFLKT